MTAADTERAERLREWSPKDIPHNQPCEVDLGEWGTVTAVCLPDEKDGLWWVEIEGRTPGRAKSTVYPVSMTRRLRPVDTPSPFSDGTVVANARLARSD